MAVDILCCIIGGIIKTLKNYVIVIENSLKPHKYYVDMLGCIAALINGGKNKWKIGKK